MLVQVKRSSLIALFLLLDASAPSEAESFRIGTADATLDGLVSVGTTIRTGDPDPALQQPGKRKHTEVTLSAGASESTELWDWWQLVYDTQARGGNLDEIRKQVFLDTLARDGETVLRTQTLNRAIPKKFVAGEFDAASSDNVIEQITLAYKNLGRS